MSIRKIASSLYCFILLNIIVLPLYSAVSIDSLQSKNENEYGNENGIKNKYRIAFYNTENFFDPIDDSLKNDNDFTAQGGKYWSWSRFYKKSIMISKVISAIDAETPLLCIGLAEIENERVLNQLCYGTYLRYGNYRYIHYPTPDPRGIGIALLYRHNRVKILGSTYKEIIYEGDSISRTRHILYVQLNVIKSNDTIHTFVLHFPSKYGGAASSEIKRQRAGIVLKSFIDSVQNVYNRAKIVVMGDFNAEYWEESIAKSINYKTVKDSITNSKDLINLMSDFPIGEGTNKFRESWSLIDHFIINAQWLTDNHNINASIWKSDFLLIPDDSYFGNKLYRTYSGFKYSGGFSDHLPICIDITLPILP